MIRKEKIYLLITTKRQESVVRKIFVLLAIINAAACVKPPVTVMATTAAVAIAPKSACGVVMWKVMHMTENGDGRSPQYVEVDAPSPVCLRQGRPEELDEVEVFLSMAPKKKGVLEARAVRMYLFGPDCLPISVYNKQFALEVGTSPPPLADKVVKTFVPKGRNAVLFVSVSWKELAGSDIVVKRGGKPVAHQVHWHDQDRKHKFWYALGDDQNHCQPQAKKRE